MGLVPSLVDRAGDIPVVAAGGISDGRGLAAALMLGATGVSMGTRLLASVEAQSSPAEAAGLVAAGAEDTRRTPVFRSEEHTSEIQSLMRISYAVIRLKKKKQQ